MTLVIADVSEFQGSIDWASYGAAYPAVIVRVHNSYRPDLSAKRNITGARRYCTWRGFYQYLAAGADPVKAAHDLQTTLGPTQPGEVLILDLEEGTGDQHSRRAAWINALGDQVTWTYSGLSFARTHLKNTRIEWLAAYGQAEPTDSHTLWQFTNARRFAGISSPCDGSTYGGTLAQLQALTHTTTSKEADMPLTSAEIDAIAVATSRKLLGTMLGSSGPTVAVALQRGGAPVDTVALAKAVIAAGTQGLVTQADLEAALKTVLGGLDGKP